MLQYFLPLRLGNGFPQYSHSNSTGLRGLGLRLLYRLLASFLLLLYALDLQDLLQYFILLPVLLDGGVNFTPHILHFLI